MGFFFLLFFAQKICDVVKVESSIGRFSQIWLQAQYEKKKHHSLFSATLLEPCIEI
jgi:hypothetical protein